ncbi:MAG: divalent-cation tolerance protein CutA [Armatimonadota bacterium]
MSQHQVVLITVSSAEEAEKIANILLNEKLAACVNMVDKIKSMYWWEGKIDTSTETLMIIKTRKNKINELIDRVKSEHSYTVPEIISLPVLEGNRDYLNWIDESVKVAGG